MGKKRKDKPYVDNAKCYPWPYFNPLTVPRHGEHMLLQDADFHSGMFMNANTGEMDVITLIDSFDNGYTWFIYSVNKKKFDVIKKTVQ